jgi:heme-degrading monooxygenase HmoA
MKAYTTGINHSKLEDNKKVPIDNGNKVQVFTQWDSLDAIQAAADRGTQIVLSNNNWGKTLEITQSNQVIF